jgi:hypothetical protein
MKNATSFDIRPTLKSGLSAPTNNNNTVTKKYVDIAISSISTENYLTESKLFMKKIQQKKLE